MPDPRHLAVLARPGFVSAASRPPRHLPDQAALSFCQAAATARREGLPPPSTLSASRRTGASWRTVTMNDRVSPFDRAHSGHGTDTRRWLLHLAGDGLRPVQAGCAWPLVSDRSARRGSGVKHDFAYVHQALSSLFVDLRLQSCLKLEGRARTLRRPSPDLDPARSFYWPRRRLADLDRQRRDAWAAHWSAAGALLVPLSAARCSPLAVPIKVAGRGRPD